jgi:hypothetical protein
LFGCEQTVHSLAVWHSHSGVNGQPGGRNRDQMLPVPQRRAVPVPAMQRFRPDTLDLKPESGMIGTDGVPSWR